MLKLKLQYFGHLMQRTDSFEKTLMLGKIEAEGAGDNRGWDGWMTSPIQGTWVWVNSRSWFWTGKPGMRQPMGPQRNKHDWETELKWTDDTDKNVVCDLVTRCQSRFNARYWMLGASALGRPRRMVWGGRREEGSGWGTHVYLWWIHFDIWQN